jgi:hypothetical protein
MINKFESICAACRQPVAVGAGETNMVGGRWVTKHAPSCPPNRGYQYPPRAAPTYRDPELDGLTGREYDAEFYNIHGMTQADYRDAVNPDEGDHE